MKKLIFIMLSLVLFTPLAYADKKHGGKTIEVKISLGTKDNQMAFVPDTVTFERGKYYRLVLNNPSPDEHYFNSDAFATHIFTRKVEVMDKDGNTIAEIHGATNGIELKPGATVEWFFLPMTKGKDLKLYCKNKAMLKKEWLEQLILLVI